MSVTAARLAAQLLSRPTGATIPQIVHHFGAIQAQDLPHAGWAVALRRLDPGHESDLREALTDGTIVRTWSLRGTLHLLPAADVTWMRHLSGPAALRGMTPKVWNYHATTREMADRAAAICEAELSGGRALARRDLIDRFAASGIPNDRRQSYFLFTFLAHHGLICPGPYLGKDQAFVLAGDWLPDQRQLDDDEALAELARRYLTGHGPATVHDFAKWSGQSVTAATAAVNAIAGDLAQEEDDGRILYSQQLTSIPDPAEVLLLPGYDEYVLGYADRTQMLPSASTIKIATDNGMFHALIIERGVVVGTWSKTVTNRQVRIVLRTVASPDDLALNQASSRLARFHGKPSHVVRRESPDLPGQPTTSGDGSSCT